MDDRCLSLKPSAEVASEACAVQMHIFIFIVDIQSFLFHRTQNETQESELEER